LRAKPEADLMTSQTRAVNAVSMSELNRRWSAARECMRVRAVDALVMQCSSDWVGGYIRWFTNEPATNGYPFGAVFPLGEGISVIEQGPFGGRRVSGAEQLAATGIHQRLTTPSYPSAHYSGHYDADIALTELRRLGVRRVGLVAPAAMYHSFGAHLQQQLAARGVDVVDCTDDIDRLKAIKSDEELALMRQVAAMQDAVMAQLRAFIRPGQRDFEIAAHAQYLGQQLGSEQGIFLCSSAPPGESASFRPRYLQGRALQAGDVFSQLIENNGAGGYYTELSRIFVLGQASAELRAAHARVLEAQRYALTLLRPGALCRDIYAAHNQWLREHGMAEEMRLSIHGMGYDMVERPLIRADEDMRIAANMAIIVHPGIANPRMFVHNTDIYFIGPDGPGECVHRTPKAIFEIQ
jgi:Xaa-Pro aminopeptidase